MQAALHSSEELGVNVDLTSTYQENSLSMSNQARAMLSRGFALQIEEHHEVLHEELTHISVIIIINDVHDLRTLIGVGTDSTLVHFSGTFNLNVQLVNFQVLHLYSWKI